MGEAIALKPEEEARKKIDALLEAGGWLVQNFEDLDLGAGVGVAVREFPLKGAGFADYMLFVDRHAVGVVEAKPVGTTLSGVSEQTEKYLSTFAESRPRALIQMASGSGKTFASVTFVYRLIKFAGARRVLFLVDRNTLGKQTLQEFQQYRTPDDGRKFTELYNVQRLTSRNIDSVSRVCITTIQRLYSMLRGEELAPELEEQSVFEIAPKDMKPVEVEYNPAIPIEMFDFIVTDECHRSIYHLWRQVLEYFDAFIVGLTATPSKQTLGFFNQNLVMEYGHDRAVADNKR